jgi:hypothetical protein
VELLATNVQVLVVGAQVGYYRGGISWAQPTRIPDRIQMPRVIYFLELTSCSVLCTPYTRIVFLLVPRTCYLHDKQKIHVGLVEKAEKNPAYHRFRTSCVRTSSHRCLKVVGIVATAWPLVQQKICLGRHMPRCCRWALLSHYFRSPVEDPDKIDWSDGLKHCSKLINNNRIP